MRFELRVVSCISLSIQVAWSDAEPWHGLVYLLSLCARAVAGVNIYDILEPCYHGKNPYKARQGQQGQQGQQQGAEAGEAAGPAPGALAEALQSVRQWPLLGGARPGRVPGLSEMGLGHTPPCLDSRCAA